MASEVDWNSLGGSEGGGGGGKTQFLRFDSGKTYTIRPVGKAVEFFKFFVKGPAGPRSVVVDIENVDAAATMLSEHFGTEIKPQHRYAMNIIDRSDGKIKILEGGKTIFKFFANWAKGTAQHPGGKSGGDWQIAVEGEGLNRRYTTGFMKTAPFSDEELAMIQDKGQLYKLSDIFKGIPLDDVIGRITGENGNGGGNGNSDAGPAASEEPVAAGGALSDDPISW